MVQFDKIKICILWQRRIFKKLGRGLAVKVSGANQINGGEFYN